MTPFGFVGDLLLRKGVVETEGLTRAIEMRTTNKVTWGRALASLGLAEESVVAATIASALHLGYLEGEPPTVAADAAALLPAEFCRKRGIVPLSFDGHGLRVA